ncbi:sensor histidine kinase [Aestuariimicrobium soli]|uniref:sensor histidine kinase n=1 Tax=Aestuariimicrobium soli TaxID=2035834 RepID=UPI003EB75759
MLGLADIALIVATTAACTAVVMALAVAALRWNRRGPVSSQFAIVVTATVAAIVSSVLAVMLEMFISVHDLTVLVWVIGIATVISLAVSAVLVRRAVGRSIGRLVASARSLGDGAVLEAAAPQEAGWREFADLHAQLAHASVQLAKARDEIAALDAARRQFFAWISHDLRTPLAGIRAVSEALDEGYAADPSAYVRTLRTRVDTLTGMVDDLFALSTLQSGSVELHREIVPLLDVVSDAVADLSEAARARDVSIVHRDVEGRMIWGDPRELTRAIGNVLANGIRYAPVGTEILVSAHHREADDHLIISILDHGPGVASEDLGHLFDVGWRAGDARTTDAQSAVGPGAGLGLAIVRGIVEAHGGDVGAQRVEEGFELTIALPSSPAIA